MQRAAVLYFSVVCLVCLAIAGCGGGGSKTSTPVATSIAITPNPATIEQGRFLPLTATVLDQNGNVMSGASFKWSSSNTAVVDVTTNSGAVCGGKWDSETAPTVCTAGPTGSAVITATSGSLSGTITVNVVQKVSRVEVQVAPDVCVSQGKTMQMTATAFDANNVAIPGLTAGNFSWGIGNTTVGTIDANGLVTGKQPGSTTVVAALAQTTGLPQPVVTCPPKTITLATNDTPPATTATLNSGESKAMTATVTDIKGNPITDISLTFTSGNPGVAASNKTGTLTNSVLGSVPGVTTVVASCTPLGCNSGVNETYYSNPVTITVASASVPKVVVTGSTAGSVIVITGSTPAAPIALPQINGVTPKPNSILSALDGGAVYIGTDLGLLRFDTNTNTFLSSIPTSSPAHVLAVSVSNNTVICSDLAGTVYAIDSLSGVVRAFLEPNVTAAAFSVDSVKALLASSSGLLVFDNIGKQIFATGAPAASAVVFSPQGSAALSSSSGTGNFLANCDYQTISSPGTVGTLLARPNTPNRLWGADSSNIYEVNIGGSFDPQSSASTIDCRPGLTATPVAHGISGGSPVQLIATPNGQSAFTISATTVNGVTAGGSASAVALTGGGNPLSGGSTPDSASVLVSTDAGVIHRIDVATKTDVEQIPVALTQPGGAAAVPNLIAVRAK